MSRCNRRDCFMEDLMETAEHYVKGFFVLFSVILGAMFLMIYYFLNYICNKQNESSVGRDIDAIQAQQELMNSMLPITHNKDSNHSQKLPKKNSKSKSSKKEKNKNICCKCPGSDQSFLSEKEVHNTVIAGNNKVGTVPSGNYNAGTVPTGNYKAETVPAVNYKAGTVSESSNGAMAVTCDNYCEFNSSDEDNMLLEPKKEPITGTRSFKRESKQGRELEEEISPLNCAKCISRPKIPTQSCCSLCCPASKR